MKPRTRVWSRLAQCALLLLGTTAPANAQGGAGRHVAIAGAGAAEAARIGFVLAESPFARQQLQHTRVRSAQRTAGPRILRAFAEKNILHPAAEIYVRAFKSERILELWVRPQDATRFRLLKTYKICALAGDPGPKRRQGDGQVPEGFYSIDLFNPLSAYHLSLRINYPNQRDRIVNRGRRMGGDIYIHGGCRSIGCLAVTDAGIQEIYWIAVEARALGQKSIPVHIFPARPRSNELSRVRAEYAHQPELLDFWTTLQQGYDYFETTRRLPRVSVDARGTYRVSQRGT
jgi:murein L,D-transpeptidase YafK